MEIHWLTELTSSGREASFRHGWIQDIEGWPQDPACTMLSPCWAPQIPPLRAAGGHQQPCHLLPEEEVSMEVHMSKPIMLICYSHAPPGIPVAQRRCTMIG